MLGKKEKKTNLSEKNEPLKSTAVFDSMNYFRSATYNQSSQESTIKTGSTGIESAKKKSPTQANAMSNEEILRSTPTIKRAEGNSIMQRKDW